MERIGVATSPRRANGQTSSGSFVTRELAEPSQEEIANERRPICVCILRQGDTHGNRLTGLNVNASQEAASAYRQGNAGKPLGQGESLATAADLLVFRQSLGRETSDGQSRQTDVRGGRENLELPGVQTQSHRHVAAARLSTATAAACPHPESQRKVAAAGHPDDERPRHASVVFAGAGTRRRDHGGQKLLRLSSWPKHG